MYIQEISISVGSKVNKDEVYEDINLLLAFYRGNGQTQGNIESQYLV